VETVKLPGSNPIDIAINNATQRIYTANHGAGSVSVFNLQ
jgi:DNA-binding beta-propeller fold protein YncE